jgi:hypothetical protein
MVAQSRQLTGIELFLVGAVEAFALLDAEDVPGISS